MTACPLVLAAGISFHIEVDLTLYTGPTQNKVGDGHQMEAQKCQCRIPALAPWNGDFSAKQITKLFFKAYHQYSTQISMRKCI